jgi:hypothetical protein
VPEWVRCSVYKHVFRLILVLTPARPSHDVLRASLSMLVYMLILSGYYVWTVLADNGIRFHPQPCEGRRLSRNTIAISCVLGVSIGQAGF